jgi:hypothetical protein
MRIGAGAVSCESRAPSLGPCDCPLGRLLGPSSADQKRRVVIWGSLFRPFTVHDCDLATQFSNGFEEFAITCRDYIWSVLVLVGQTF